MTKIAHPLKTTYLVIGMVMLLVAAACGDDAPEEEAAETTTEAAAGETETEGSEAELVQLEFAAVPAITSFPAYVALEGGFWLDENIEAQITTLESGSAVAQGLAAGEFNAGSANMSLSTPVARNEGTPVTSVIATGANPFGIGFAPRMGVIATTSSGIDPADPATFAGKKAGATTGTSPEQFLIKYLQSLGVPDGTVEFLNVDQVDSQTALQQNIVDIAIATDPYVLRISNALGDQVKVLQRGGAFTSDILAQVALDPYIEENPDVMERMVRGLVRATLFMKESPEEAGAMVTSYVDGLTVEEAVDAISQQTNDPRLSVCVIEDVNRTQLQLIEDGIMERPEPFPFEELFNRTFLDKVLEEEEFVTAMSSFDPVPTDVTQCEGY